MATVHEIKVPDIGGTVGVDVIEILVKVGDTVAKETPLITLESDKASMEIPSPEAGIIHAISIKLGDKLSEGDLILTLSPTTADTTKQEAVPSVEVPASPEKVIPVVESPQVIPEPESIPSISEEPALSNEALVFAGPSARRLAHTLGVNLVDVRGSGRKSRISKEDIELYVKTKLSEKSTSTGFSLPTAPSVDFSKFGAIEVKPLGKIKRLTAVNVQRAWLSIPHVTQFDMADITDLESFRQSESKHAAAVGYKLTILAFVCKVVQKALMVFPQFNASLDPSGEQLIYKHYTNIGIAVETPNGLVVPVIKAVDQLSVSDIAKEMARLSTKAREKGLMPADMSGGCFTISSLGGIGGHAFTPIVNSPEVAILGLSRSSMQAVYQDGSFVPRLMLPLSLSYDHRVIDGAEAARFTRFLCECLSDLRRIIL